MNSLSSALPACVPACRMPYAGNWRGCVKCVCVVPPTVVRYSWFFTLGSAIGPRDLRSRSPIRRLPVVCLGGCKMCVCRGHGYGSHAADVKTTDPHVTENVQGFWLASSYLLPPSRTATVHGSSWPWGGGDDMMISCGVRFTPARLQHFFVLFGARCPAPGLGLSTAASQLRCSRYA